MPNPSLIPPVGPGYFSPVVDLSRNMGRLGARGYSGNLIQKTLTPEEQSTMSDVEARATTTGEAVAPVESEKNPDDLSEENRIRLERLRLLLEAKAPTAMAPITTQPQEKTNAPR